MGDEIKDKIKDKALIMVNHQSTSDVPLIMAALDGHEDGNRNIMWIMDRMFKKTNFGLVSWFHRDFFISSVRITRPPRIKSLKLMINPSLGQRPSWEVVDRVNRSFAWRVHSVPENVDSPLPWRRILAEKEGSEPAICSEEQSAYS